ncbi:MAG: AmmeMemoRadiSam system radical SAM enzyme [Candidatus Omnitrophica bacterium]|nr:AmmeMemoRadiSam system radical SAM enzyme [Candidatus Omnitrophota bacterium]
MKNLFRLNPGIALLAALIIFSFYLPAAINLQAQDELKEALFYEKLENKSVQCQLCPRRCFIPDARRGFCGARENREGVLYALTYAKAVSAHPFDPIEKKPFFHYLPGAFTFSVATAGCNLRCKFCQNWEISQRLPEEVNYRYLEPAELLNKARESGRNIIAYTYNEPVIFFEYMLDTAKLARARGLKNVIHSNGYVNPEPLRELSKYLDAANIDLKGFSDDFYAKLSEGTFEPVLKSLKLLKQEGVHLEITNLVISGYNDDLEIIRRMCVWIKDNLGADTPLHFSRARPEYKLTSIIDTPVETLEKARQIALDCGLKYVYIGNVPGHPAENTYCPKCNKMLIRRAGIVVLENNLENGRCKFCGEKIEGVWN